VKAFLCASLLVVALSLQSGCGSKPPTYPVQGMITLLDGDINVLADSHVELELEGDSTVRASGVIDSDGRFEVHSLHKGQVLHGALAGRYRVRVVLADEDKDRRKKGSPIRRQFLDFKTSGLVVTVPTQEPLALAVSRR
jgi:hypothetical protein